MRELRLKQRNDMAPVGKLARLLIRAGLPRHLGNQRPGNEVANLLERGEFRAGWTNFLVFHTRLVAVNLKRVQPILPFSVRRLCFGINLPNSSAAIPSGSETRAL